MDSEKPRIPELTLRKLFSQEGTGYEFEEYYSETLRARTLSESPNILLSAARERYGGDTLLKTRLFVPGKEEEKLRKLVQMYSSNPITAHIPEFYEL